MAPAGWTCRDCGDPAYAVAKRFGEKAHQVKATSNAGSKRPTGADVASEDCGRIAKGELAVDVPLDIGHLVHAVDVGGVFILPKTYPPAARISPQPSEPSRPMPVMITPRQFLPKVPATLFIKTSADGMWPLTVGPSQTTAFTDVPIRRTCRCFPPGAINTRFGSSTSPWAASRIDNSLSESRRHAGAW